MAPLRKSLFKTLFHISTKTHRHKRRFDGLFSILYPFRCPGCLGLCDPKEVFCPSCRISVEPIGEPMCPRCFTPYESGISHLCTDCRTHPPPYERAVAVFRYGGQLAHAIHRLKYGKNLHVARSLGSLMSFHLNALHPEIVTPVPLAPRRLRKRGFNQSNELIKGMDLDPDIKILPSLLSRKGGKIPQVDKPLSKRKKLRAHHFSINSPKSVAERRILVVDDVMTTGATARACSQALLEAGAKTVSVLVLARTVR